jgi:RES domain
VVKSPRPPQILNFTAGTDTISYAGPLFRIFRTAGAHPSDWNELRRFGPIPGMRFDPFLPPPAPQIRGVMYASVSLKTAFAEVFQRSRVITAVGGATLAGWIPARPLQLVDMTSDFLIRNGAGAAVMMGPKRYTQEWAEVIDRQLGDQVDGIWHLSSLTSLPLITLLDRSASVNSFPLHPSLHRAIDDPLLRSTVSRAADALGYGIR